MCRGPESVSSSSPGCRLFGINAGRDGLSALLSPRHHDSRPQQVSNTVVTELTPRTLRQSFSPRRFTLSQQEGRPVLPLQTHMIAVVCDRSERNQRRVARVGNTTCYLATSPPVTTVLRSACRWCARTRFTNASVNTITRSPRFDSVTRTASAPSSSRNSTTRLTVCV